MFNIYKFLLLVSLFVQVLIAKDSFIVLDSEDDKTNIVKKMKYYEEKIVQSVTDGSKVNATIKKVDQSYILRVGPFESNDFLALVYFKAKKYFPNAFIVEEKRLVLKVEPVIETIDKKVYNSLWVAMFALAFLGIIFMFLSSGQMKRMKLEHQKIKLEHDKLELKQNEALSIMGENIHNIAKETMNGTYQLSKKIKETSIFRDVGKVMNSENELVDVTGDLLRFLRLKSNKVLIKHEVFNFNHVLNEVSGRLNTKYKQNDIELIFDIDKDVPRYMLADSVHLGHILINILEYFIQNSQDKEVKMEATTVEDTTKGLNLRFRINADIDIEHKETLFDAYYDEATRHYVGLGLFIAKELIYLMGGELQIKERNNESTMLIFTLPIEVKNNEKRKYRLPNKGLVGKKILIVDRSHSSALATQKLFVYFKAEVDILSAKVFIEQIPDLRKYDIVALNHTLFNPKVYVELKKVKNKQDLKVISLENLFTSEKIPLNKHIDIRLEKPLTQEYVFDTLIELYMISEDKINTNEVKDSNKLMVYSEVFEHTPHITLESFASFGKGHLLIVEDDIVNQNIFLEMLGKSNIKVSVVNNGEEAIDFLHHTKEHIDMVFMNINMPVMDGYMASEIIRKETRFNQMAIVFLSALASEHEIVKMLKSGINGYLSKPLEIEQLYTALKAFITPLDPLLSPTRISKPVPLVLEGLNIEFGIKNLNGNIIFYKQVLQEFLDAYAQNASIFESLVREQRYGQIKVLCSEMKGLTGTIGAKEMHIVINDVHQCIIYKKPKLLHSYVTKYKTTLDELIRSINLYLSL